MDIGFGDGTMLSSLPHQCTITGVDVSPSGVASARIDPRFKAYRGARFEVVEEDVPEALPAGPFDALISSHMLEHVRDEQAYLRAFHARLRPGGHLLLFVPIEPPDYIEYHRRAYSLQSVAERVAQAGFELRRVEGGLYVNGHIWRLLTVPSRRGWPLLGPLVDGLRLVILSALTYRGIRLLDGLLYALGFAARQAFVVARRPPAGEPTPR